METKQIYTLVNELASMSMGKNAITVANTGDLVALGNAILSSATNTEALFNTLAQRITRTVFVNRMYTSIFADFVKGEQEFGAITQKISVSMPKASNDDSIPLTNGQSVDPYIVSLPEVQQFLFVNRTPYNFFVTFQRKWLKEAFINEAAFAAFFGLIYNAVANALEIALENLTRATIANYASLAPAKQVLDLVTMYNTELGLTAEQAVPTGLKAMHNPDFMRYATGVIKEMGRALTNMSVLYNAKGLERFSPLSMQRFILLNKFRTQLENVALYSAFNDDYLKLVSNYTTPYWQATGNTKPLDWDTMSTIEVNSVNDAGVASDKTLKNIIGMMFDRDALGVFKKIEEVLTTPVNARGSYYNTFWSITDMYFNALDENFILLTLN